MEWFAFGVFLWAISIGSLLCSIARGSRDVPSIMLYYCILLVGAVLAFSAAIRIW